MTCNITSGVVGNTVTLSSLPSNGYAPYTVNFYKNNSIINTKINVNENELVSYPYSLTSQDVGTVVFSSTVTDSCPLASQTSLPEICSIVVTSTQPPSTCNPQPGQICVPGIGPVKTTYVIAGGAIGLGLIALMILK